ncbi:HEAT repeat protein [Gimesia panareensis]|uniref:HEAT repeat protein n=1 Tax=Gimesia panareensis TaxID=2527978 RepID=A0A518FS70_9PLAN|nr:HEAT repeat domain-containing protein [Gimesia panareensis]QDV19191.1 HEAT repeat protein [Gimesia panareensis]
MTDSQPDPDTSFEHRLQILQVALTDPDFLSSHRAAECLVALSCGNAEAAVICEALKSDLPETRRRAAYLCDLLSLHGNELVPGLLAVLNDRLWITRESAALALGAYVSQESVHQALLERVLFDKNEIVRDAALRSLSCTLDRHRQTLDALRTALKHSRHTVRTRAATALARFPDLACFNVACLTETLTDSHWRVRLSAANTLRTCGPAAVAALPALIRRRYDGDRRVRTVALEAIRAIYPGTPRDLHRIFESLLDRFYDAQQILENSFKEDDFPAEIEAKFAALCLQRIDKLTNQRRSEVIAPRQESSGWETACGVVKATELAGLNCHPNKEFTRLLAWLVETWLEEENREPST